MTPTYQPSFDIYLDSADSVSLPDQLQHSAIHHDVKIRDLTLDEKTYLERLQSPRTWTNVEPDCLCFPDMHIDSTDTVCPSNNSFIHAYRLTRAYGPNHLLETVFITNCSCAETQKLSNMLAGGYDTSTQSFQDLLVFFEVKDRCIHTRYVAKHQHHYITI